MTDAEKAPTKMLLSAFDQSHRQKFGVPAYIMGAKHATILARIWRLYGTERLVTIIDKFFEGNSFADDCGYSIEVFASQVPRTLMQLEREKAKRAQVTRIDWRAECEQHHEGRCGSATFHAAQMDADQERKHA